MSYTTPPTAPLPPQLMAILQGQGMPNMAPMPGSSYPAGPGMAPPGGPGMGPGGAMPFGHKVHGMGAAPMQAPPMQSAMSGPGIPGQQPTINPATGLQQFNLQDAQMSGPAQMPAPPPPGGAMPPPQLPPQVLQMLMQQRMQQQGGGMPPGGAPMPPPPGPGGSPQPGMAGPPPALAPRMPPPGSPAAQGPQGQPMSPQAMAGAGRTGDSIIAHMAPGEIAIPPQVQAANPQLMQMIHAAFMKAGVNPSQFTAGSASASHNPTTGQPEFNILSSILPVAGAALGSFIPGIGTAAGMAAGGALGGAAGGALNGGGIAPIIGGALGGGVGGYAGGGGFGSLGGLANTSGAAAANSSPFSSNVPGNINAMAPNAGAVANPELGGATGFSPGGPAETMPSGGGLGGLMGQLKGSSLAGIGAGLGSALAPVAQKSILPPGFNNNLPPTNPQFGALNGSGVANTPSFGGYNPYAAVTQPGGGYTFYKPGGAT